MESFDILIITVSAFFASVVSGISGLGGGIITMATLGQFLPAIVLLPIHGIIQFSSNFSRVILGLKSLELRIIKQFLFGAIVGALIGYSVVLSIPSKGLGLLIAVYLLVMTWLPIKSINLKLDHFLYFFLGIISTLLSLFVGVSGPIIHPVLAKDPRISRLAFIPTEAACSGITHLLKFFVFLKLGLEISNYFTPIVLMIVATFAGVYVGKKILTRMSERGFRIAIKIIMTILAIRMLWINL